MVSVKMWQNVLCSDLILHNIDEIAKWQSWQSGDRWQLIHHTRCFVLDGRYT